jgi:4-oxalocrotonate tautomerase
VPHVIVKLWPGNSDARKRELTDAIVRDVTGILGSGEASVSVAIEEIQPDDWMDAVFEPEIAGRRATLTKPPGYGPALD